MNENTHSLQGTQRLVRAIRRVSASVARSEIATSKSLATVSAIGPLTVTLDGSSVAVAATHLSSYTPAVGDRVFCETFARQVMVHGTFV